MAEIQPEIQQNNINQDVISGATAASLELPPKIENPGLGVSITSSKEGLHEDLESPTTISEGIIFIRHGNTEKNAYGDQLKLNSEPLTQQELESKGSLHQTSEEIKKLGINPVNIRIHFPHGTLRCIQSAKLIAQNLGVSFPKDISIFEKYHKLQKQLEFIKDIEDFLENNQIMCSIEKDFCYIGDRENTDSLLRKYSNLILKINNQEENSDLQKIANSGEIGSLNHLVGSIKLKQNNLANNKIKQEIIAEIKTIEDQLSSYPIKYSNDLMSRYKGIKEEITSTTAPIYNIEKNNLGQQGLLPTAIKIASYLDTISSNQVDRGLFHIVVGHRNLESAFDSFKQGKKEISIPDSYGSPGDRGIIYQNQQRQIINQSYPRYVELSAGSNEYIKGKPEIHASQSHVDHLVEKLTSISDIIHVKFYRPQENQSLIKQQNYLNNHLQQLSKTLQSKDNKHKQSLIEQMLSSDNNTLLHLLGESIKHNNIPADLILKTKLTDQSAKILFEYSYPQQEELWNYCFSQMTHNSRLKLELPIDDTNIQDLIGLYAQKESYLTGSNKHLLQIKPIDRGEMMDLEDIYVEQQFDNSQGTKSTTQIADQLISQPGSYLIHGAGGEGKSTTLKAIAKHLLTTHNPPPLITWITPDTDLEELMNSDLPQVWFIDSLDELGSKGNELTHRTEDLVGNRFMQGAISCIAGTRIGGQHTQDHVFTAKSITEEQKDKYVSSYLNDVFGTNEDKPRGLMEATIAKLGLQHTNPLIIAMITQIMEDDDLSIELENIQTKSDLYKIFLKILKKKEKEQMTKEEKKTYLSNQYKGEEFDSKRAYLTGKLFLNDSWHLINPDDSFRSDNDPDYANSELNDSLFYSGLIHKDKEGKIRTLHQSIFDYCANQYLTQHPNFTQDIKSILGIDLGDIQESIGDDFEYQGGDIKSEQNKHYQEQLKKVTSSVIGSLLDGMYFNSSKEGDDLMNKLIGFLYSEEHAKRRELIANLLINNIKENNNTNINKEGIIETLETILDPKITPKDINNYLSNIKIRSLNDREEATIKGINMKNIPQEFDLEIGNSYEEKIQSYEDLCDFCNYKGERVRRPKLHSSIDYLLSKTHNIQYWISLSKEEFKQIESNNHTIIDIITNEYLRKTSLKKMDLEINKILEPNTVERKRFLQKYCYKIHMGPLGHHQSYSDEEIGL